MFIRTMMYLYFQAIVNDTLGLQIILADALACLRPSEAASVPAHAGEWVRLLVTSR